MTRQTFIGLLAGLPAAAQVLRMGEASEGYEALFNGRDMGRWEGKEPGDEEHWKVEDAMLLGSSDGSKEHVLLLPHLELSAFEVRLEIQVLRGAAGLRMQIGEAAPLGMELRQSEESLQLLTQGKRSANVAAGNPRQWREYHVIVTAQKLRLVRNPLEVAVESSYALSGVPAKGKLALVLAAGAACEAGFRRLRIKT
jgi:hypothetical protein